MTAVAASVVGAGVLAAAWNAGEREAQVTASATGIPAPSTTATGTGTHTTSPGAASPSAQASSPSGQASSPSARASAAPASPTAPPAAATRQVNGPAVSTPYGPVQVQVDLSGSRITDVVALKLTNSNRTSQAISASAAPLLRQEALAAQSAHIDGVSGATYTSQGYEQSLQAALDAAHA